MTSAEIIRKATTEVGSNTMVRLGAVCTVGIAILGGVMWLNTLHEKVTLLEHKLTSAQDTQRSDKDALEKRLDRIEAKLDRALERK